MWRFFFMLDAMHVFDCRGVASTVFGSLASMLTRNAHLGANQQARLLAVNGRLQQWYAERPGCHRLPELALQNLTGG